MDYTQSPPRPAGKSRLDPHTFESSERRVCALYHWWLCLLWMAVLLQSAHFSGHSNCSIHHVVVFPVYVSRLLCWLVPVPHLSVVRLPFLVALFAPYYVLRPTSFPDHYIDSLLIHSIRSSLCFMAPIFILSMLILISSSCQMDPARCWTLHLVLDLELLYFLNLTYLKMKSLIKNITIFHDHFLGISMVLEVWAAFWIILIMFYVDDGGHMTTIHHVLVYLFAANWVMVIPFSFPTLYYRYCMFPILWFLVLCCITCNGMDALCTAMNDRLSIRRCFECHGESMEYLLQNQHRKNRGGDESDLLHCSRRLPFVK